MEVGNTQRTVRCSTACHIYCTMGEAVSPSEARALLVAARLERTGLIQDLSPTKKRAVMKSDEYKELNARILILHSVCKFSPFFCGLFLRSSVHRSRRATPCSSSPAHSRHRLRRSRRCRRRRRLPALRHVPCFFPPSPLRRHARSCARGVFPGSRRVHSCLLSRRLRIRCPISCFFLAGPDFPAPTARLPGRAAPRHADIPIAEGPALRYCYSALPARRNLQKTDV